MSFSTRSRCAHDRDVFVWLGDGPGDDGTYPWVHSTTMTPGHLEVCELMPFATAEEVGQVCVCGHPCGQHDTSPRPIPCGMPGNLCPCSCGCPDFRHRPEDIARWRAGGAARRRG